MDVFLVPVGPERYEPYCEVPDEPDTDVAGPPSGFFRRLVHRFKEMIADAERERRMGTPAAPAASWLGRIRARTLRWVAESMAEQKLLWHLRKQACACVHYPDDVQEAEVRARVLREDLLLEVPQHEEERDEDRDLEEERQA